MSKKTVVIGASPNTSRYSNKAVNLLRRYGHSVVALGIRKGKIADVPITLDKPELHDVHTVTMYVGPKRHPEWYDYILNLKPQRLIFNPGTENSYLKELAEKDSIEVVENCTLVMLRQELF